MPVTEKLNSKKRYALKDEHGEFVKTVHAQVTTTRLPAAARRFHADYLNDTIWEWQKLWNAVDEQQLPPFDPDADEKEKEKEKHKPKAPDKAPDKAPEQPKPEPAKEPAKEPPAKPAPDPEWTPENEESEHEGLKLKADAAKPKPEAAKPKPKAGGFKPKPKPAKERRSALKKKGGR
jgi:hypothetical protein